MFLMRVFAFEFLLGLACMGLFVAAPARAGYFCSAEAERGGIQYSDSAGIQWEVTNLRFEKTPFLGSYLSCAQLLDQVGDRINASTALTSFTRMKNTWPGSARGIR